MSPLSPSPKIAPRIIIHGGSGNITRRTLSREAYDAYQASLRNILSTCAALLSEPGATALDVAAHAVSMLEDDPLYNSGKGAVFARNGIQQLECSIMASKGYRKRGVGCMMLQHVKNPIKLARELLIRGDEENGGGGQDHTQYSGEYVEGLAKEWGLDIVDPGYFFTQKRWDEHLKGLADEDKKVEMEIPKDIMSDWQKNHYIPLGTCGTVVLDSFGTVCVATSTGGLTNKLPGRIGDTPTMGAGYWAQEWHDEVSSSTQMTYQQPSDQSSPLDDLSRGNLGGLLADCFPNITTPARSTACLTVNEKPKSTRHAAAISGTGNGDFFIRLAAASTAISKARFTRSSLADTLPWMAGRNGELQRAAGDRWGKSQDGIGGMIGIELIENAGQVVSDYNCGGMFRAWVDAKGEHRCLIFREDSYESGPKE